MTPDKDLAPRFLVSHRASLVARTHSLSTERTETCITSFCVVDVPFEDRYDRTAALLVFDSPCSTPNLHYQPYCIGLPVHPRLFLKLRQAWGIRESREPGGHVLTHSVFLSASGVGP